MFGTLAAAIGAGDTAVGLSAAGPATAGSPATGGGPNSTAVSAAPTVHASAKQEPVAESFADQIPPKPETLHIGSEGKPLAFGSLMETPAAEPEEDVAAFVAPPNPELADRDWDAEAEDEG